MYDKTINRNPTKNDLGDIDYIKNNIKTQNDKEIYLYTFSGGNRYFAVFDKDSDNIIEKVPRKEAIPFLWSMHGPKKNNQQLFKSVVKKLCILGNDDKSKYKDFLNRLTNDEESLKKVDKTLKKYKLVRKNPEYVQSGGILIWLLEKYIVQAYAPNWLQWVVTIILEVIDIALAIASSIPGLQAAAGAGFIIDAISIVYSILRFDIIGTIAGIISIIPLIGDIGGGGLFLCGKVGKYLMKARKAAKVVDAAADVAKGAEAVDDIADAARLAGKLDDISDATRVAGKVDDVVDASRAADAAADLTLKAQLKEQAAELAKAQVEEVGYAIQDQIHAKAEDAIFSVPGQQPVYSPVQQPVYSPVQQPMQQVQQPVYGPAQPMQQVGQPVYKPAQPMQQVRQPGLQPPPPVPTKRYMAYNQPTIYPPRLQGQTGGNRKFTDRLIRSNPCH